MSTLNKLLVSLTGVFVLFMMPLMQVRADAPLFLPETEQSYFSDQEMLLLENTAAILEFEVEYDHVLKLYYLTAAESAQKEMIQKKSRVVLVLQKRKVPLIKSLYEKLFEQYRRIEQEMEKAESDSDSRELKNYLSPLKEYCALLEEHISARDSALRDVLNEKKKRITASVKKRYERAQESPISFFTREEIAILESTTHALDLDYGYDEETNLAYIYSFSYSDTNIKQKERFFTEVLEKLKSNSLLNFYKKIYRLYVMTKHRMDFYKDKKEWKYYIFIKNELLPPVQLFYNLLERNINEIEPSLSPAIEKSKKEADQWVKWYYRDKEQIVDTF